MNKHDFAVRCTNLLETYDPAFGYAENIPGWENREQVIQTFETDLGRPIMLDWFRENILAVGNMCPQARTEALALLDALELIA